MSLAIISDVHSNLEALESVFAEIDRRGIKKVFFLGDAVGYGPNPNECVELICRRCEVALAGNHDWGVLGLTEIRFFNSYAKAAIEWTKGVISDENRRRISDFPLTRQVKAESLFLVHSTPKDPEEWHYLITLWDAEINFSYFSGPLCFLGHTHRPSIIERLPSGELLAHSGSAEIRKGSRYIVNAGSVGQPRDGDPRACMVLVESSAVGIVRVDYDRREVERKMSEEGLPAPLIERLGAGR
jgi:predicted phosphodiesterase